MLAGRIASASIAVLVVAALWYAFRPQTPVATTPTPTKVVTSPSEAPAPIPQEKAFAFVVRNGKLFSGPAALQVRQGEHVRLNIESNADDELHLHGYDFKLRIKAGEPATLEFAASRSGRFGLELHKRHSDLGALEVYPQ
jgi:hypothetical protein